MADNQKRPNKFIKTDTSGYLKNPRTNVTINTMTSDYQRHKLEKEKSKTIKKMESDIQNLFSQIQELRELLANK